MLDVLINNDLFIACNKAPGMAAQPDKTGDDSLLDLAEKRCKRPLHPVNRLDRPVSGIALFAKTRAVMTDLTDQFRHRSVEKVYLAVVQNEPPEAQGKLVHFLQKNQSKNTTVAHPDERPGAERAELDYKLIGKSDRYFLLEIHPVSGKHHQIRAQLAAINCPIKGDVKYGARRSNADRSIHLHAWKLTFAHPRSGAPIELVAAPPKDVIWDALLNGVEIKDIPPAEA
ncbi:MAG: RNA pseudouridine synthase [Saprospiraceae bacterium]|nr:RNA pseudouridine synthase [Saprospiraceae bacterium]